MQDNNKLEDSVNMDYDANNDTNGTDYSNSPISPISTNINQYNSLPFQNELSIENKEIDQDNNQENYNQEQENSEEHYADNENEVQEEQEEEHYDVYINPLNMISNLININPNTNAEITINTHHTTTTIQKKTEASSFFFFLSSGATVIYGCAFFFRKKINSKAP